MDDCKLNGALNTIKLLFQIAVLGAAFIAIVLGERERVKTARDVTDLMQLTEEIRQEVVAPCPVDITADGEL